jgi:acetyltransferase-like isoleucine patch superfamily enzyme
MHWLGKYVHMILSLPKTLWFNGRYLGWAAVWRTPVVVSHRVILKKMAGQIIVPQPWHRAMIRIGFGDVAVFDRKRSRSIWHNQGLIVFSGSAILNHGSRISVAKNGHLLLGDGFHINAETTLVCRKKISFGRDCLLSWDVLIMDSDMHQLVDPDGVCINPDAEIRIGDHVWVGCRAMILKGSCIGDHTVIAAQSVVNGVFDRSHVLLAGSPARIVKQGIQWQKSPGDWVSR